MAGLCPLARLLALMAWNRGEPLRFGLVRRVAVAPPSDGPIVARLAQWLGGGATDRGAPRASG